MTGTWGSGRGITRRTVLPCLILMALVVSLAPGATATGEAEAQEEESVELEMGLPLTLAGTVDARATEGAWELGPSAEANQALDLRLEAARMNLTLVRLAETRLGGNGETDLFEMDTNKESTPRSSQHGPYNRAKISLDEATRGFYVMAHAKDDQAVFAMDALPHATLDNAQEGDVLSHVQDPGPNHHTYKVPDETLAFTSGQQSLQITGDFTLLFYGTTLDVHHRDGTDRFETGRHESSSSSEIVEGGLPVDPFQRTETRYAVLRVQDATLTVEAPDQSAQLLAKLGAITIDVDGVIESPSLLGTVQMQDEAIDMEGDSARMEGRFTMQPVSRNGEGTTVMSFQGDVQALTVGPHEYRPQPNVKQAAGIALILAGLGATVWQAAKSGLLVTLYAKLTRRKVLDQTTRQQVFEKVQQDPGCTTRSVASALSISWSTAAYHLRVLRHMSLITAKRQGRHEHHFLTGGSTQTQQNVQTVLQNPTTRRIAQLIREHPGIIQKDVCRRLGIAASTASDHLKRLREAGAVVEERQWRTRAYHPARVLLEDGDRTPFVQGVQIHTATAGTSA